MIEQRVELKGLESAIIGVSLNGLLIYERQRILSRLIERDGMSPEGAAEFIEYNIDSLKGLNGGFLIVTQD